MWVEVGLRHVQVGVRRHGKVYGVEITVIFTRLRLPETSTRPDTEILTRYTDPTELVTPRVGIEEGS